MLPLLNFGDVGIDCLKFLPELLACGGIVLFLFLRLFDRSHMGSIALAVTLTALGVSIVQWTGGSFGGTPIFQTPPTRGAPSGTAPGANQGRQSASPEGDHQSVLLPAFGGMLIYDHVTIFLRCFLYGFTAFIIWLSLTTGIPDREDSPDFYCLLLGATVGMVMMASALHLLMVYIGVEMASLPSYALAGYLKGRRQSSEAALKYVVYGGGASGVMLYGISLLAGRFGTAYLPDLAQGIMYAVSTSSGGVLFDPVLVLGILFVLIGIAFKLAAVPFHFWCPDVFEGAAAEVAAFLSVASKGAAIALLARIVLMLTGADPMVQTAMQPHWSILVRYLIPAVAFFAALTATFGNLAAYVQTNLKRLLAYSTIAHAGYMMMGLAAFKPGARAEEFEPIGLQAVLFYLVAYLFMNLGAFAVVAFLRNQTGSEELDSYRGLVRRSPWMVVTLSLFLLSLLGIPPLVGFAAKFQIFSALWDSSQAFNAKGEAGLGAMEFGLLIVGGLNSVLSAVYYLKVMKVMILEGRAEDLEGREPVRLLEPVQAVFFSVIVGLFVVVLGVLWNTVDKYSHEGAGRFAARTVSPQTKGMGGRGGPKGGPPGGAPPRGMRMGAPGKGKQGPRRPKGQ